MRPLSALRLAAVVLALSSTGVRAVKAVGASEISDDVTARRARVMERLGPETMMVLLSAPTRTYSLDVDYEYRQDSNLYYLTGLSQEDTALVLMPGNATRREILFIKDQDPAQEHWTGRVLSHDAASAATGIRTVLSVSQFEPFLAAMLSGRAFGSIDAKEAARFFDAIDQGHGRLAMPIEAAGLNDLNGAPTRTSELARKLRERFVGFQTVNASRTLTALRLIKTSYEQKLLIKAADISSEAHLAGMRAARPGAYEYEVKAAIEAVHRGHGAVSWAYPSIVGSGPNATILHYADAGRQMQSGELLLVDAACNFEYMSPDITRTYPVSGTFSPAQRDLYALVLEAQDEAAKVALTGSSIAAVHTKTVEVIKAGLLRLGLITDTAGEQYRLWFTHGATHYIGIDVHDVGERTETLQPGMAFVIEPGLYIRQSALDTLPRTAENTAFIEKVQPAVKKYEDIGVRVEDSFLLGTDGLHRLSASVPRTIEDIESFMRKRRAAEPTGAK